MKAEGGVEKCVICHIEKAMGAMKRVIPGKKKRSSIVGTLALGDV